MKRNEYVRGSWEDDNETYGGRRTYPKRRQQSYPFPFPDIHHMDCLAGMTDDELSKMYVELNSQRDEVLKRKLATQAWDEELAYIQRETKIRSDRRSRHKAYTEAINREIAKFFEEEATLPEFVPNAGMDWLN